MSNKTIEISQEELTKAIFTFAASERGRRDLVKVLDTIGLEPKSRFTEIESRNASGLLMGAAAIMMLHDELPFRKQKRCKDDIDKIIFGMTSLAIEQIS